MKSKDVQILLVGGPYDGWGQRDWIDKGQTYVVLGPPPTSDLPDEVVYVYLRDDYPWPDGWLRWFYDPLASLKLAVEEELYKPDQQKLIPGLDPGPSSKEVRLDYVAATDKWELWVDQDLIATCPGPEIFDADPVMQRKKANEFREAHISQEVVAS